MFRTQISLSEEERSLLDHASARTGRSMSSLIREAVRDRWGARPATQEELDAMEEAFGSWGMERPDGEATVERLRSNDRLTSGT